MTKPYVPFQHLLLRNKLTGVEFLATLFAENAHGEMLICPDYRKELIWISPESHSVEMRR